MISPCYNSCCGERVNLKEWVATFGLLFCSSSKGWQQLELQINSIPLKNVMTASACFKET